ncbi:MAG: MBL fold metallo-hydrolase [Candidatus Obscuribacterales bacterium]|nr:MBL fold metallo-hydrolase [Candidatus Obscuribacterales bacterium]
MLIVETFPVGPLQCNCSIIGCKETGEAAVVDPGGDPEHIYALAEKHGLTIKYLLHTHAHFDHILGSRAVKEKTGAKICLHKEDQWLYDNLHKQCSMFGFTADDPLPVDRYLDDEEEVKVGDITASVLYTPGHTPGSLCFSVEDEESIVFAGDTLFSGSIGRTDLWGGDFDTIIKSISNRLLVLDDSTKVVPGHGPQTSIFSERKHNPYLK